MKLFIKWLAKVFAENHQGILSKASLHTALYEAQYQGIIKRYLGGKTSKKPKIKQTAYKAIKLNEWAVYKFEAHTWGASEAGMYQSGILIRRCVSL